MVGNILFLYFETDYYPSETKWKVFDENNTLLATGGPYSSANTLYQKTVCLPLGLNPNCYRLTLHDTYGDGLESYGELRNDQDEVLLYVDDFIDNYESYNFCYFPCLAISALSIAVGSTFPNAGSITIFVDNSGDVLSNSIDGCQSFQAENEFTDFTSGIYDVVVQDDDGCLMEITQFWPN